jgi:hypothetical protein
MYDFEPVLLVPQSVARAAIVETVGQMGFKNIFVF